MGADTRSAGVVIPWKDTGCPHRAGALAWVLHQWHQTHPDWPVTLATDTTDGPWVKATAVTPAVEAATADVVIVSDADVWCDDVALAVEAVEAGAGWAIPHRRVLRLTVDSTAALYAGTPTRQRLAEPAYTGLAGGGITVLPRPTYLDVPLDPRFVGWGSEDQAWALALTCLADAPWRGRTNLIHLWHPPQERLNRRVGSEASEALRLRYRDCRIDPDRMRALLEEISRASAL